MSSSRFQDVVDAVKSFDCLRKLKSSVIVDITARDPGPTAGAIQEVFGTAVHQVGADEVNHAFAKADSKRAREFAGRWIREAERVVEPTTAEIE